MTTLLRLGFAIAIIVTVLSPYSVRAVEPGTNDLGFLEGISLIELETDDIASMHVARRLIQSYGGTVAIMSPPSLLVGVIPYEIRDQLIGKTGIKDIYHTEVLPGEVQTNDSRSEAMVGFFNAAVRGELAADRDRFIQSVTADGPREQREPDLFSADDIDPRAYLDNLLANGLDAKKLEEEGLPLNPTTMATAGNSDYMTGTVALTLFFVESDGTGSDPDQYTWTPEHMQNYINGVGTALYWWSSRAAQHGDCWVTFLINYYSGADERCQQWVEPILHTTEYEETWINEIMSNFGYTSGTRFSRVSAFNTWQRSYYNTDRSYSAFIPYNPAPAAASFPGGGTAYAYWYGPHTVLLYHVQGWTTAEVFAHETGHIFGACDEYAGGCSSPTYVCANGVINGNCEVGNPDSRDCMMKENSFSVCTYTVSHLGWEINNPCAPAEPPLLPTVTLSTVDPPSGFHGVDTSITLFGSNFYPGIRLEMGDDIFVHGIDIINDHTLIAHTTVLASAPPGLRNARVFNRDGQFATLTDVFEVLPTTRHYYSPTGGDGPPYLSPANAATSFEDAIAATYDGDTLFVVTMTFDDFSLIVNHGVVFHGGWNNDFSARDLETGKTLVNLNAINGNITFTGASQNAGFDGFTIQNGTGVYDFFPFGAYFGGAVRFVGGSAVIANCEISSSAAGGPMNYGLGGAVFADGCQVDIRDSYIHDNAATQGGALYLRGCTGTVSGNTISGNSLFASPETLVGGGVAIVDSPEMILTDNVFSSNTSAAEGGGLYVENCPNLTMTGGSLSANEASFAGGGVRLKKTTAVIDGVEFNGNTSAGLGGGLAAIDSTNATLSTSTFVSNSAAVGGGAYATAGSFFVTHNLFTGNASASTGGALVVSVTNSGTVIGNTLNANSASGVGGLLVGGDVEIFNNIVTNNTGLGVSSTSGQPPVLSHNLTWNNSGGDYSNCTPGDGSISADPIFVDPAGGDYHLALHSPAIDAGIVNGLYTDPDGSRGDLGVYGSHTFQMEQPAFTNNLAADVEGANVVLEWDKNPESDIANYAVYCDTIGGFTPSELNFVALVSGSDSTTTLDLPADSSYYVVSAVDTGGYAGGYSAAASISPATGIGDRVTRYEYKLGQNVPNPFNPVTTIAYQLPARTNVELNVYDVNGRLVRRLVSQSQGAGSYSITWAGKNDYGEPVASGVYFYRLNTGSFVKTRKMVLLK